MIHLKLYEDFDKFDPKKKQYWKVRLDTPYYEISLFKLGIQQNKKIINLNLENILSNDLRKKLLERHKFVYIGVEPNFINKDAYYYNVVKEDFDEYSSEYMGEIEVTDEDIKKWEFENNVNKYNL